MKIKLAAVLLAGLLGIVSSSSEAQTTPAPETFAHSFETNNSVWTLVGGAGFDISQGYARTGLNNGFIRESGGWNAIQTTGSAVSLPAGYIWQCTASAYLRSSGNVSGLFMSALNGTGNGSIIAEVGPKANEQIGFWPNYQYLGFNFSIDNRPAFTRNPKTGQLFPRPAKSVAFRVGFWGNGADAWVQVDDVNVTCTGSGHQFL